MQKISSESIWFTKRGFPAIFFGFLLVFLIAGVNQQIRRHESPVVFVVAPLGMGCVLYFMFRQFIFDLVDEVWDDGDTLVVRNRKVEVRIPLQDIVNVTDMTTANWPRVTLLLRDPCELGASISFSPKGGGSIFSRGNPIALELIKRVDAARRRSPETDSDDLRRDQNS